MVGVAILLGLVYLQTATYLTRRNDGILAAEAALMAAAGPEHVLERLQQEVRRDPLNAFALYDETGQPVGGDPKLDASALPLDGGVREFRRSAREVVRAQAVRLPWGETLVVARDAGQIVELRRILLRALVWSGSAIALLGAAFGFVLGREPLRRIQAMRLASDRIVAGDLSARLPVSRRRDELDELAVIVNAMMEEVERLMVQARTAGESVAHELRTPLTRLRASLEHASEGLGADHERRRLLELCVVETDGVLARFRALLRIAAVEAKSRRAEIGLVDLSALVEQVAELYQPLAAERGLSFQVQAAAGVRARVDGELFFEAMANLVDNAIKFTPAGGQVTLELTSEPSGVRLEVGDTGPGIADADLPLITRRFYRGARQAEAPGHGLGLSLVAAVVSLHGFHLAIQRGEPGTRAIIRLS